MALIFLVGGLTGANGANSIKFVARENHYEAL
jgi:hypothetical protein